MDFEIVGAVRDVEVIARGRAIRESRRLGKIYVALRDAEAERNGLLRVVDESGEDYLYSRSHFALLKLPRGLQQALADAG